MARAVDKAALATERALFYEFDDLRSGWNLAVALTAHAPHAPGLVSHDGSASESFWSCFTASRMRRTSSTCFAASSCCFSYGDAGAPLVDGVTPAETLLVEGVTAAKVTAAETLSGSGP